MELVIGRLAMRVTLFAHVSGNFNPYILLYKETLERQGLTVHLERRFDLNWLITRGKSCDAIHLHWMEGSYKPSGWNARSGLAKKLIHNRFSRALRGVLRLANFSVALFLAKLQGKTIVYTVHNLAYGGQFRPFIILDRMAHRVVLALSHHIHAHSHYARKILETAYNREDGIIVVPLGNYIEQYPN
ncbi:MAG: glycosyltransferase [Chloroflexi bacterium]|nr:glycosyltransferase [Chloroflexota bacterium]